MPNEALHWGAGWTVQPDVKQTSLSPIDSVDSTPSPKRTKRMDEMLPVRKLIVGLLSSPTLPGLTFPSRLTSYPDLWVTWTSMEVRPARLCLVNWMHLASSFMPIPKGDQNSQSGAVIKLAEEPLPPERAVQRIIMATTNEMRPVGRPWTRWIDQINGLCWRACVYPSYAPTMVYDRAEWKRLTTGLPSLPERTMRIWQLMN